MTTQACNLVGRIPSGPIYVHRFDGTVYCEGDPDQVSRMVKAGVVEGIGPRNGCIKRLRITCTEDEAVKRLQAVSEPSHEENPGSITSMASREIFREILGDSGGWVWCHKANRNMTSPSFPY